MSSIMANPSPVAAPMAAPYLRFGKTLTRAYATRSMQTALEVSSVIGAINTGVNQFAVVPRTDAKAPWMAIGKITPRIAPVAKAIRKARGISRSVLNSGGCS